MTSLVVKQEVCVPAVERDGCVREALITQFYLFLLSVLHRKCYSCLAYLSATPPPAGIRQLEILFTGVSPTSPVHHQVGVQWPLPAADPVALVV